jgi:hypothetical protein
MLGKVRDVEDWVDSRHFAVCWKNLASEEATDGLKQRQKRLGFYRFIPPSRPCGK